MGQTIQIQRVRDAYQEALDNPAEENVFKQLRLNMWVSSLTRFIPEHIYDLAISQSIWKHLKAVTVMETGLVQHWRHHGFCLMFPPRVPEEKYIMLPFFWIPEDTDPPAVRRHPFRMMSGISRAT